MAVQGEICGPGIQKNRLGLKQIALFAFNVYDIAGRRYLDDADARAFLAEIGVPTVEVIERGDSFGYDLLALLRLAEGKYPGTQSEREGIVVRPQTERHSEVLGGRLSFKSDLEPVSAQRKRLARGFYFSHKEAQKHKKVEAFAVSNSECFNLFVFCAFLWLKNGL